MMNFVEQYKSELFKITDNNFKIKALEAYRYQYQNNVVYRKYCNLIHKDISNIYDISDIPFLPIELFKYYKICSVHKRIEKYFVSSGTTGQLRSKHYISDLAFYHKIATYIFENSFTKLRNSIVLALLPTYIENPHSSLIHMVQYFIECTHSVHSQFLQLDQKDIDIKINLALYEKKTVYLFSVTHALLELCKRKINLSEVEIIETGGMKGKGKEITKEELYSSINEHLNPKQIHSEYGMTELLSQAYAINSYWLTPPNWMRVLIREINDPFHVAPSGKGALNIIDLANIETCPFIATQDMGIVNPNGQFYVSGRLDHSDLRGCNLLYLQ